MKALDLDTYIANSLDKAGIAFHKSVDVGGLEADFAIPTHDGRVLVLETKNWEKKSGVTNRAARQAQLFRRASGVKNSFVVVNDLHRSKPMDGVLAPSDVVKIISQELETAQGNRAKKVPELESPKHMIFAAMPFAEEYEDTYVAMVGSAESVNAVCKRVDREEYVGNVLDKIESLIRESRAVVADLSESKPNVLYEAGFARGIGKPTISISSTAIKDLPFDVAQLSTIEYKKGQTNRLRTALTNRLRAILAG